MTGQYLRLAAVGVPNWSRRLIVIAALTIEALSGDWAKAETAVSFPKSSSESLTRDPVDDAAPGRWSELLAALRTSALVPISEKSTKGDLASPVSFPLQACVFEMGLCGAVNRDGNVVIQPRFDWIGQFHEGRAAVRLNGLYGYIDTSGKVVSEPQFDRAGDYWHRFAEVDVDGKSTLLDRDGRKFSEPVFARVVPFQDDVMWVKEGPRHPLSKFGTDSLVINRTSVLTTDVLADGDWKLVDRHGTIKQTPKILSVQYFELGGDQLDSDRSMWARTGDGWGLINADGAWNVPPKYQQVGQLIHGLAAVRLNNKWGYLSRSGDVAIETQFDEARAFSENRLAAVKVGNLWGYIDITGAAVIKPQFDRSEAFGGDGYAAVSTNNMWGMIDQSGRWIIEPLYDRISHDHKDIAWVETKGKLGAFDLSGRLIVAPQFSQLPALCEDGWIIGFADGHQLIVRDQRKPPMASNIELAGSNCEDPFRVREGGGFTFLDRNLQRISEKKFDAALLFSEHAAAVQVGGKFGYVDRDGRWTIEPRFDDAQAFRKGIAIVKVKDKFGYVRVDGTWLAEPEFEEAAPFEDGFAIVVRGGKRGVIDSKGAWVAATALRHFDSSLDKGLVPFSVAGQWGFADAAGAVVIEPRYDAVTPFSRGLAWTKSGGDWCPIDRQAHKIPKISCQGDMPKPSFALRSWPY